jgi:DNA-binding MltR family transcriptional regulator
MMANKKKKLKARKADLGSPGAVKQMTGPFFVALREESDRGCVLAACQFLDHLLEQILYTIFALDPKRAAVGKSLLDQTQPLSTFAAHIKLPYCLQVLPQWLYEDLEAFRELRNYCAHNVDPIDLSDKEITHVVERLGSLKEMTGAVDATVIEINESQDKSEAIGRTRFRLAAAGACGYLSAILEHLQESPKTAAGTWAAFHGAPELPPGSYQSESSRI